MLAFITLCVLQISLWSREQLWIKSVHCISGHICCRSCLLFSATYYQRLHVLFSILGIFLYSWFLVFMVLYIYRVREHFAFWSLYLADSCGYVMQRAVKEVTRPFYLRRPSQSCLKSLHFAYRLFSPALKQVTGLNGCLDIIYTVKRVKGPIS